jgi:hypothetical protein
MATGKGMVSYLFTETVTTCKIRASGRSPEVSVDPFATVPSESNGEEDPTVEGVPQAVSEWGGTRASRTGSTSQCQVYVRARGGE